MNEEAGKKKIVLKKKSVGAKPVIKLNKPAAEKDEDNPPTEQMAPTDTPALKEEVQAKAPPTAAEQPAPPPAPVQEKEAPFKFYCVYCGQKLSAAESMIGKTIACPACKHKIQVPTPP